MCFGTDDRRSRIERNYPCFSAFDVGAEGNWEAVGDRLMAAGGTIKRVVVFYQVVFYQTVTIVYLTKDQRARDKSMGMIRALPALCPF